MNKIFHERNWLSMYYKKRKSVSSLVLGIVGLLFSFIMPIITFATSIPGLVIGIKHKKKGFSANPGIVLNIVALAIALVDSILVGILTVKMLVSSKGKEIIQFIE